MFSLKNKKTIALNYLQYPSPLPQQNPYLIWSWDMYLQVAAVIEKGICISNKPIFSSSMCFTLSREPLLGAGVSPSIWHIRGYMSTESNGSDTIPFLKAGPYAMKNGDIFWTSGLYPCMPSEKAEICNYYVHHTYYIVSVNR